MITSDVGWSQIRKAWFDFYPYSMTENAMDKVYIVL